MTTLIPHDGRNVVDHFKYWNTEAINAILQCNSHSFSVAMEHWVSDLNIGSMIRNANAFLAREVHYIGKRQWDRRGAVGTHHYVRLIHHWSVQEFVLRARLNGYQIICVDNVAAAKPIESTPLPKMSLFVFGTEALGISQELLYHADDIVYIKQYGSVRSLNASVASGIVMYEWIKQHT